MLPKLCSEKATHQLSLAFYSYSQNNVPNGIDRFEDSLQQSAGIFPVRIFSILYSSPQPRPK